MKSNKNEILRLYFEKKLKQVDIAKKLNISKNAVSKTLKMDNRFEIEKNNRKELNKKKHNKKIQNIVENKRRREKEKNDLDYLILKSLHQQASLELSAGKKVISNRAFRDWNTSIYKFNKNSKSYVLKNGINVGYGVPKKIYWN